MQAAALAAGKLADPLLLIGPLEVEAADIGACRRFVPADSEHVGTTRDFLENGLLAIQAIAALVDVGELDRAADLDFAGIGLFGADQHPEEGRFAGTVGADDADDGAGRDAETKLVDEQAVAEGLADILEVDHLAAQPLADRDEDLLRLIAFLVLDAAQFIKASQARLALRLPCLRVLAHPFQLLLHGPDASCFLLGFGFQPCFLLLEPARVVALPWNALAAVEFKNPFGGVVEKIAIMGDGDHRAGEAHQELFEPFDRLGVQVVGRLVEQQHVGLREQQLAQRHPPLLATGEGPDRRFPGRQAQGVGRQFELTAKIGPGGGQDRLEAGLLFGELVEIGVRFGVGGVDLFQLGLRLEDLAQTRLHFLADVGFGVELRFLRQIADLQVGHRRCLADDVGVESCHDAQNRRLARAVEAEQADLGAREEGERDVLDDLALGRDDLAHAVHREYVLSHGLACRSEGGKAVGRRRANGARKAQVYPRLVAGWQRRVRGGDRQGVQEEGRPFAFPRRAMFSPPGTVFLAQAILTHAATPRGQSDRGNGQQCD